STTLCSNFSHCGNGVKELGEACDDGSFLNGKYNHCKTNCTKQTKGETPGFCGDDTKQDAYEVCDSGTPGVERYSLTSRNESCSWDCQNWGPYCGDSLVQTNHGETCDGSQTCSVDGNPGAKVCSSGCQKKDRDAAAWWRFETLEGPSFGKYTAVDTSANVNSAKCASSNCPVVGAGKYGHGLAFSSSLGKRYLIARSSPSFSLVATSSLTVEAWIYPMEDEGALYPYQRIVEKEGPFGFRSYDLEFNASSTAHTMRFNLWNSISPQQQTSVDSNSSIATNTWTHVVGTYARNGSTNVLKMYVNGVLENTNTNDSDSATPIMAVGTGDLSIGKSATVADNYFFGSMDEIKIYNRALSAAEVQNNYQSGWFCEATSTPVLLAPSGSCGDNVIDANEACDQGTANNGLPCVPAYGVSCSYCSADCQNSIDVQSLQYCGNGVIEAEERCEISAGNIYSASVNSLSTIPTTTSAVNGYQEKLCSEENLGVNKAGKGVKTCVGCALTRNCVTCGLDPKGVEVNGKVLNVLQTEFSGQSDPLMVEGLWSRNLQLFLNSVALDDCWKSIGGGPVTSVGMVDSCGIGLPGFVPILAAAHKDPSTPITSLDTYTLKTTVTPPVNVKINSNLLCSTGEEPTYTMVINSDYAHRFQFPVLSDPSPGQYDIIASPIITSTRSKDVRVVVSWESTDEFFAGFVRPGEAESALEGGNYGSCFEISGLTPFFCITNYATGTRYYAAPFATAAYKKTGIWYHGFISSGKRVESFTVDTAAMNPGAYTFYVRTPDGGIEALKNIAKLKVEVFLPETDPTNNRLFGAPAKTYYLKDAIPSDNRTAGYWQVFNLSQPSIIDVAVTASHIMDVNRIFTNVASMAIGSCTGLSAGTQCRMVFKTSLCDVLEYCTGTSDFCPADQFRPAGVVCRVKSSGVSSCDVEETCTGTSASCPVNSYAPAGTSCGTGICDTLGICDGCGATLFRCSLGGGCQPSVKGSDCDDGDACTGSGDTDVYTDDCGTICAGTPKDCRETPTDNPWTTDSCVSSGSCQHAKIPCDATGDPGNCVTGETKDLSTGKCNFGTGEGVWTPGCCNNADDCPALFADETACYTITCAANVCGKIKSTRIECRGI
ncbi:MAG: LamG-like jellyroll fold domain-containing protein, partial [Patescibacteria group bacterium]